MDLPISVTIITTAVSEKIARLQKVMGFLPKGGILSFPG
jgi:hypothetical protein